MSIFLSSFDSVGSNVLYRLDAEQSDILRFQSPTGPDVPKSYVEARLSAINTERNKIYDAMAAGIQERTDQGRNFNWSGTVLRICIISLIIFLVQILIQLYRYNSRLIAFYSSRRDALLLSEGDSATTKVFTGLLAPTGLDFGREPNHPLREMAQFLNDKARNAVQRKKSKATAVSDRDEEHSARQKVARRGNQRVPEETSE